MEYYKFGGGRGSSRVLKRDTYIYVMTTTTTTTTKRVPILRNIIAEATTKASEVKHTSSKILTVDVARFVPVTISILVIVIFVVLFTLIVVLHKLKNVRSLQSQPEQRVETANLTNRQRFEAELAKVPSIHDVNFLKNVFPHLMKVNESDLGLNL